jgi:nitrate/TMAO reductase-like tetraheme cytochrome c subunit
MTDQGAAGQVRSRQPSLIGNWTSMVGVLVAACSFFAATVLLTIDLLAPFSNPYMGILVYLIAPAFLVLGLVLVGIGAWRERRRRRRLAPGVVPEFPRIDFNLARQRRVALVVVIVVLAFLLVTAVGSYQTYEYSESVSFCGRLCHDVMRPEFTAYQDSPHARVACVDCHIGPGASWFVRSKISGAYQVYATLADVYPRPIPTPIENLRPAQQTCERCHWPAKFYGDAERVRHHFLSDERNSPWTIRLLMKVGGGNPTHGPVGGIHWHMNIADKVEYIAADARRQVIPWVRVTRRDGTVTVYQSADAPLTAAQIATATPRVMDCIDCHNRPSHDYLDPSRAVDIAMSIGRLDPTIPSVKKEAVDVLAAKYASTPEAEAAIAEKLSTYYDSQHAHFAAGHRATIERAIAAVREIYRLNFFPEMRVDWKAYPDNIGHLTAPGCYRCHDGNHVSADGKTVTHDCDACHVILAQGPAAASAPQPLEFQHPADIGDLWQQMSCDQCHSGGPS